MAQAPVDGVDDGAEVVPVPLGEEEHGRGREVLAESQQFRGADVAEPAPARRRVRSVVSSGSTSGATYAAYFSALAAQNRVHRVYQAVGVRVLPRAPVGGQVELGAAGVAVRRR